MNLNANQSHFNLGKLFRLQRLLRHSLVSNEAIQKGIANAMAQAHFSQIIVEGIVQYYRFNHQFKINEMINTLQLQIDEESKLSCDTEASYSASNSFKSKVLNTRDITNRILLNLDFKSLTCCKLLNLSFLTVATEQQTSLLQVNLSDLCKLFENQEKIEYGNVGDNNVHVPFDLLSIKNVKSMKVDAFWSRKQNRYFQQLVHFKNLKQMIFDMNGHSAEYYANESRFRLCIKNMILNNMMPENYNIELITVNLSSCIFDQLLRDTFNELCNRDQTARNSEPAANLKKQSQSKLKHVKIFLTHGVQAGYIENLLQSWFRKLDIDLISVDYASTCSFRGVSQAMVIMNSFDELRHKITNINDRMHLQQANFEKEYNVKRIELNINFATESLKQLQSIMNIVVNIGVITAVMEKMGCTVGMNNVLRHVIDGSENRCKLWQNAALELEKSKRLVDFTKSLYAWYEMNTGYLLSIFGVAVIGNPATTKVGDLNWIQLIIKVFKHIFVQIDIDDDWDDIKLLYVQDVNFHQLNTIIKIGNRLKIDLVKENRRSSWTRKLQTVLLVQVSISGS